METFKLGWYCLILWETFGPSGVRSLTLNCWDPLPCTMIYLGGQMGDFKKMSQGS